MHYFARHLAAAGNDVTVIAELPNHPKGVVFEGFRGKLVDRRRENGIDVMRVWVHASPRKPFWRRITFYLSYAINATLAALLLLRRRPDVIFASSPPLPVLLVAATLSLVWRRPFVADIRDIWPAVGVALGELRGRRLINEAQRVERALYRRAAAVTVVTEGFREHVMVQGADPDKVHLVPNGTLPEVFTPDRRDPDLRARLGLDGAFVVGYVGNHGIAQGLGTIVEAARLLQHDARVRFLFVGEGPIKADLVAQSEQFGADNIVFHPQVAMDEVAPYINACDVLLVPLRNLAILDTFVPSKMFDFMACQKPVIVSVNGEARRLLDASGGGYFMEPENPSALAALIGKLVDDGDLAAVGKQGREWVRANYSRHDQGDKVAHFLQDVADGH